MVCHHTLVECRQGICSQPLEGILEDHIGDFARLDAAGEDVGAVILANIHDDVVKGWHLRLYKTSWDSVHPNI